MKYIKDNEIFETPIKIKVTKQFEITNTDGTKTKKFKTLFCFTNDENLILANGFIKVDEKTLYRYSKRKIKSKLVQLGYWNLIKESLTDDQYQDLLLSDDFAFDDELFVRCYQLLKTKLDNIDELLLECRK